MCHGCRGITADPVGSRAWLAALHTEPAGGPADHTACRGTRRVWAISIDSCRASGPQRRRRDWDIRHSVLARRRRDRHRLHTRLLRRRALEAPPLGEAAVACHPEMNRTQTLNHTRLWAG